MATQTTGGGSTTSFSNTPQAKDDTYGWSEDQLLTSGLYSSGTKIITLDVVSNDLGGNAKTKTRHEVSGSGKKLWKQKGTGRARIGSIRSPLWRHGGTTFGPVVRDYSYKLPRKMQLGALRSALSAKLRDGELKVVQEFNLTDHKTKSLATALKALEGNRKVLLVDILLESQDGSSAGRNLVLSSRNLEGVKLLATREVTVYDLLGHQLVLMSEAAAKKFSEALAI